MSPSPAPVLILDGGLGTTLQDHYDASSIDPSTSTSTTTHHPLWSSHLLISSPATLLAAQTAFALAGADILLTATYQASLSGFALTRDGRSADAAACMQSAVGIARAAFGNAKRSTAKSTASGGGSVALSLGAYGAVMSPTSQEYTGWYDEGHCEVEQLRDWHAERLDVYMRREEVWRGVDMVAFETLPLVREVRAVRMAMEMVMARRRRGGEAGCGREKPFWISCVFPGEGLCLPDGSSVEDVVRAMLATSEDAAVPFAIGINCTKIGKVVDLLEEYESAVKKMVQDGELGHAPALVLYPDGTQGEVYNTATHEWEQPEHGVDRDSPPWDETMFDIVQKARTSGVWSVVIAGGCCKTTPDDIKKLRQRVDEAAG